MPELQRRQRRETRRLVHAEPRRDRRAGARPPPSQGRQPRLRPARRPRHPAGLKNAPIKRPFIVSSGEKPSGNACEALHWHGYVGMEREAAGVIAGWVKTPANRLTSGAVGRVSQRRNPPSRCSKFGHPWFSAGRNDPPYKAGTVPAPHLVAITLPVLVLHHSKNAYPVCDPQGVPAILRGMKDAPIIISGGKKVPAATSTRRCNCMGISGWSGRRRE